MQCWVQINFVKNINIETNNKVKMMYLNIIQSDKQNQKIVTKGDFY